MTAPLSAVCLSKTQIAATHCFSFSSRFCSSNHARKSSSLKSPPNRSGTDSLATPYEAKDVKATYQRILANEYSFPSHIPISDNAKDMIRSMLQSKPQDRPSLQEIAEHPFFAAIVFLV